MSKPKPPEIRQRTESFAGAAPPDENRRMAASLSSEAPIRRLFGTEVLEHSDNAINMERAANGLPLLLNHDRENLPIGRVENISLDQDKKLRGDLVFSEATDRAREAYELVRDGTLRDTSISYSVDDYKRAKGSDAVTVTAWTLHEVSLVSVPADSGVGIGRAHTAIEDRKVSEENTGSGVPDPTVEDASPSVVDRIVANTTAGAERGAIAEMERQEAIASMGETLLTTQPHARAELTALIGEARKDRGITVARFNELALGVLSGIPAPAAREAAPREPVTIGMPAPSNVRRPFVQPGGDAQERACKGMEFAMLERAGEKIEPKDLDGNQYRGWSFVDLARECLDLSGNRSRGMSSEQIIRHALSTSDPFLEVSERSVDGAAQYATANFTAVTANVFWKRVNAAFREAPVTWNVWCSTTEVPDFRQFNIPRISQYDSLPTVAENAAYTNLARSDAQETATLLKYGGVSSLTMELMINDDQRMLASTASDLGVAAARTLDNTCYAVLTDNNAMGDAVALFAAGHNNTQTGLLTQANIIVGRTALARQTDDGGELLAITFRYLIVPEELRDTAEGFANPTFLPWPEGSPATTRANTIGGSFQVVSTVKLTDANDWYMAGNNGQTVEVAFLRGNRTPAIERENGWDRDALHFKIRHPHVAYAIDWRGLQRFTNV